MSRSAVFRFPPKWTLLTTCLAVLGAACGEIDGDDSGYECPTSGTGWWEELPYPTIGIPSGRAVTFADSSIVIWGTGANDPSLSNCAVEADCDGVTGARFDLASRTWRRMSEAGAPEPRSWMGAISNGSSSIYWGGTSMVDGPDARTDGGIYDPDTDTWGLMADAGAGAAREYPTLAWMDGRLFVWGGYKYEYSSATTDGSDIGYQFDGLIWDAELNTWSDVSSVNSPDLPVGAVGWTGEEILVFTDVVDAIGREWGWGYDVDADTWRVLNHVGAMSNPRRGIQPIWTGREVIKFEGYHVGTQEYYGSGRAYDPVTDAWRKLNPDGAPHWPLGSAVWTGTHAVVMGREECLVAAVYDSSSDEWVGNSAPLPFYAENHVYAFNTTEGLLLFEDIQEYERVTTGFLWHPD